MRFFFLLLSLPAAHFCWAQVTSGAISGNVNDPSDRPIAGARVRAESPAWRREVFTSANGAYQLTNLPPGDYRIFVQADRFSESVASLHVGVHTGQRVDFVLALAGVQQTVEVRETQRDSAELGATITRQKVDGLPLNRRDFLQLALLVPGVSPAVEGSQLAQRQSFAMHVNGAREESNNFLLDGVDNNDPDTNRYALQPPVDAIEEFQLATNGYSAEYSRNSGGQVNVVTRSGGEAWHGFGYEYLRNRHLDARNYFSGNDKPQYVRNQFGVGAGGALRKHSTFVFANWDGLRERRGLPRLGTVPQGPVRTGDLSGLPGTPVDPFTRQPFPGKIIPANRINPISLRVLSLFPAPNLSGTAGNLLSQPVQNADQNQWNARVDQRIGDANLLTFRYSRGAQQLFEPFAADTASIPAFGDFVRDRSHNALAHYQHQFSARTSASFLAGFNRVERRILQQNNMTDVNSVWGVSYLPTRPPDLGYPAINIAGFSPIGDATQIPIDRAGNTFQLNSAVTSVRGQHTLKSGIELRRNQHNGINNLLTRGSLTFSGAVSGTGAADLLLGYPSLGIQAQADNTQTLRMNSTNVFLLDDWKVTPRLTINLGVRYEYNSPPADPTDRMSVLNLGTGTVSRVGTAGVSRSGFSPDYNNVAPRLGIAWAVDGKTTIRAAYGVFYDAGLLLASTALYFNPPYFVIRVFFPSQTSLLTLDNPFPRQGGITPAASLSSLSPNLTTAYTQQWNLNLQRQAGGGVATIGYAASKGTRLLRSRDLNQPLPGAGDLAPRRPLPSFANIFFTESGGNSTYHSFQASYQRALARRWSMIASYTLSKSIDDSSAFLGTRTDKNFPQNSRDFHFEKGRSSFDQRHRLSVAAIWRAPFGMELSTVSSAASGQSLTPILRFDNSNTGNSGGQFGNDRPNILHSPALASPSAEQWFDTTAFTVPARYTFGNAGRNIITGPGFSTVDISLARTFRIGERVKLRFEWQAFNVLNHTNLDNPEKYADEPSTFGRIFSAKAPRQMQVSARITF